jgi:hypothetical protein
MWSHFIPDALGLLGSQKTMPHLLRSFSFCFAVVYYEPAIVRKREMPAGVVLLAIKPLADGQRRYKRQPQQVADGESEFHASRSQS